MIPQSPAGFKEDFILEIKKNTSRRAALDLENIAYRLTCGAAVVSMIQDAIVSNKCSGQDSADALAAAVGYLRSVEADLCSYADTVAENSVGGAV